MRSEIFIERNLPMCPSREECNNLFLRYKNGDLAAREEIIVRHIRRVKFDIVERYKHTDFDFQELLAVGLEALIIATDTFDLDKGIGFHTYSRVVISNKIQNFLKKEKLIKRRKISFDRPLYDDSDVTLTNILYDPKPFFEDYYLEEEYEIVKRLVSELPIKKREIVMLYYGFYGNKCHTYEEIGKMYNVSTSYIGSVIREMNEELRKKILIEYQMLNSGYSLKKFKK